MHFAYRFFAFSILFAYPLPGGGINRPTAAAIALGLTSLSSRLEGSPSWSMDRGSLSRTSGASRPAFVVCGDLFTTATGVAVVFTALYLFLSKSAGDMNSIPSSVACLIVSPTGNETSCKDAAASSANSNSESTSGETAEGCGDDAPPDKPASLARSDAGSSSDTGSPPSTRSVAFCSWGVGAAVRTAVSEALASSFVNRLLTQSNRRCSPNVSLERAATPK